MKKRGKILMVFASSLLLAGCGSTTEPQEEQEQEQEQQQKQGDASSDDSSSDQQKDDDAQSDEEQKQDDAQSDAPEGKICPTGFTGDNCDECAANLAGANCDIQNSCLHGTANLGINGDGHCVADSCTGNFTGENCDQCTANFTGDNCDECAANMAGANCDIQNSCLHGMTNLGMNGDGHCLPGTCTFNFTGEDCDQCSGNFTGEDCLSCSGNFAGQFCDECKGNYAGENCDQCATGFTGDNCEKCINGFSVSMADGAGHSYKTTCINGGLWMAENMSYATGHYAHINDDEANDTTYGLLYDWATASTVCPAGWHLPTLQEFQNLLAYVDANRTSSSTFLALADITATWLDDFEDEYEFDTAAQGNDFGFSALPTGGNYTRFWSSTEIEGRDESAYSLLFYIDDAPSNTIMDYNKVDEVSVRCLKDAN